VNETDRDLLADSVLGGLPEALLSKHNHSVPIISGLLSEYLTELIEPSDEFLNCSLFVYENSVCRETVEHCTTVALDRASTNFRVGGVIIHLLVPSSRDQQPFTGGSDSERSVFVNAIKRCERLCDGKRLYVTGLVLGDTEDRRKLVGVIVSLIYDRNSTFNGVTLIL